MPPLVPPLSPSVAPTVAPRSDPARSTSVRRDEMTSDAEASGLLSMYSVRRQCDRLEDALSLWLAMIWQRGDRSGVH